MSVLSSLGSRSVIQHGQQRLRWHFHIRPGCKIIGEVVQEAPRLLWVIICAALFRHPKHAGAEVVTPDKVAPERQSQPQAASGMRSRARILGLLRA